MSETAENISSDVRTIVAGEPHSAWWVRVLTWLCRLCVGGVFIYSGFVKGVDPWGTIYKMDDYLSVMPDALSNLFSPLLTVGVFALFGFEFIIGVFLVTGSYRRLAPLGAGLLMLVMLPLTLWIALTDPVADCGCFGDALILSNWATFWKNVVITVMVAWLLRRNNRCRCLVHPTLQWLLFAASLTFIMAIGFIGYSYQPVIDYRPYPVGGGLTDSAAEETPIMAVWEKDGKRITIPADSIPEDEGWIFIDRVAQPAAAGQAKKKTRGLAIFDEAEEITDDVVLTEGEQVVVFMTDLPSVSSGAFYKLNSLYSYCKQQDVDMIAVVAATPIQIEDFISMSLAEYPVYTAEDTAIKEVVRGNPAVVYLEDGKIIWKSSLQSIPTDDFLQGTPAKPRGLRIYQRDSRQWLDSLSAGMLGVVCLLILLSHVPLVIRATLRRRSRSRYGKYIKDGSVVKALAAVALAGSMTSCHKDEPEPQPVSGENAVLIYMVATNNLNRNADADLQEMLDGYEAAARRNTDFYVYIAHPDLDSPELRQLVMDRGKPQFVTLKSYSRTVSSVAPSRISEVIDDFRSIARAPHNGIIFWSHATAWLPGSGQPAPPMRSYGDDYGRRIGIPDLAAALPDGFFDFIWMDCCFMGNIETVYELRDKCSEYVASPTEVLAKGAPYQIVVRDFCELGFDLCAVSRNVFDSFLMPGATPYYTVAITDTGSLDDVAAQARAIAFAGNMSTVGLQSYGSLGLVRFYDFGQSYLRMAQGQGILSAGFEEALNSAVTYKAATDRFINITINQSDYSGLSCSLPSMLTGADLDEYRRLQWWQDVYMQ